MRADSRIAELDELVSQLHAQLEAALAQNQALAALSFERTEEALHQGVVIGFPFPTHTPAAAVLL